MRLLTDINQKNIKIQTEHLDDLWTLSTLIDKGDKIRAKTTRKIVIGDKSTEKAKTTIKKIFLGINTEKITFTDEQLRILGTIFQGPDDIAFASHHTIALQPGDTLEIEKEQGWLNYQKKKLKEAVESEPSTIICCLFNREEAILGKLQNNYFVSIGTLKGDVAKKGYEQPTKNFFETIAKSIKELNERYNPSNIILGSSNFWHTPIKKEIENSTKEVLKKIIFITVNTTDASGFTEVLKNESVTNAIKNQHAFLDTELIENIFKKIAKEEPVTYGIKDTLKAGENGAIETLAITDTFIKERRENDTFQEIEHLFKATENAQGTIHIITGKHEAATKLDGLGGIAATLRFQIK